MIFLLEYDRAKGLLLSERHFDENQIEEANRARLAAELAGAKAVDIEIVILRSNSRTELVNTHGRYFKTLEELLHMS